MWSRRTRQHAARYVPAPHSKRDFFVDKQVIRRRQTRRASRPKINEAWPTGLPRTANMTTSAPSLSPVSRSRCRAPRLSLATLHSLPAPHSGLQRHFLNDPYVPCLALASRVSPGTLHSFWKPRNLPLEGSDMSCFTVEDLTGQMTKTVLASGPPRVLFLSRDAQVGHSLSLFRQ